MSNAPIQDAIAEALREEGGTGIVTGFIVLAEYIDEDGDHCWFMTTPDDQRLSTSIGQAEWLRLMLAKRADDFLDSLTFEDDDDA